MPPDERDHTTESDPAPPLAGEWGAPDPTTDVVAEVIAPPVPAGAVVHPEAMFCRRCGETAQPVNNRCAWCGLWLVGEPPRVEVVEDDEDDEPEDDWHTELAQRNDARRREPPPPIHPGLVVGVSYVLLIGSLFVLVAMAIAEGIRNAEEQYGMLAVIEILDAVLTVTALALVWRTARQPLPEGTRLLTWVVAFPVLFALLCLNIAYITFLRELVKPLGAPEPERIRVTFVTVMLICVQPAIVEELFFRQMVLGVFRKWMNLHGAIWVTAAMFAFAHLGNPIGMPYLLLGGAVFGYARAFGGLSLAMLLHFIHNFVVIAYEAWIR
jgi:membrane protease YdiL (CAAX protease family)